MNKRFHGKIGREFDISAIAIPHRKKMHELIGSNIKKELKRKNEKNLKALEIGFGTGYTTKIILNSGKKIELIAIDNEEAMLKQAKKNLFADIKNKRVKLVKKDALEFLKKQKSDSYNFFISSETLHNFKKNYRNKVLKEIYRILKSEGVFINEDKYALDNLTKHKKELNWQLKQFKNQFNKRGERDLIKIWTKHYIDDEKTDRKMKESESINLMKKLGFKEIRIKNRIHMEAILTAVK